MKILERVAKANRILAIIQTRALAAGGEDHSFLLNIYERNSDKPIGEGALPVFSQFWGSLSG
jgi:hypothetical protein